MRQRGQELKDSCYQQNSKGLDGAKAYAKCILESKHELSQFERIGKYRLMFMEIAAEKNEDFNLIQSITGFIEDYGLGKEAFINV